MVGLYRYPKTPPCPQGSVLLHFTMMDRPTLALLGRRRSNDVDAVCMAYIPIYSLSYNSMYLSIMDEPVILRPHGRLTNFVGIQNLSIRGTGVFTEGQNNCHFPIELLRIIVTNVYFRLGFPAFGYGSGSTACKMKLKCLSYYTRKIWLNNTVIITCEWNILKQYIHYHSRGAHSRA